MHLDEPVLPTRRVECFGGDQIADSRVRGLVDDRDLDIAAIPACAPGAVRPISADRGREDDEMDLDRTLRDINPTPLVVAVRTIREARVPARSDNGKSSPGRRTASTGGDRSRGVGTV